MSRSSICLMAAMIVCAGAFGRSAAAPPPPLPEDNAFFAMLDCSLPGLGAVGEAGGREDWAAAQKAYCMYLGTKFQAVRAGESGADSVLQQLLQGGWAVSSEPYLCYSRISALAEMTSGGTPEKILETVKAVTLSPESADTASLEVCWAEAAKAVIFFEFKDAAQRFQQYRQRLLDAASDFLPDGSTAGCSVADVEKRLAWIRDVRLLQEAFHSPIDGTIPKAYWVPYERAIHWSAGMHKPNGGGVPFNGGGGRLTTLEYGQLSGMSFNYFGRNDFRWFATQGESGVIPAYCSSPLNTVSPSYAGLFAMRGRWTPEGLYAAIDFGPMGKGGHADFGSFILDAYGADLIDEGGPEQPGAWAHNVMAIDGHTQSLDAQLRPELGAPIPGAWISNDGFDCARGEYPFEHMAEAALRGIRHKRMLYFAKPNFYLLTDTISGRGKHTVQSTLQLGAGTRCAVYGNDAHATASNGAQLYVLAADERPAPSVAEGATIPIRQGWVNVKGIPTAAAALLYEETRGLPCTWFTVLMPLAAEVSAVPVATAVPADDGEQRGVLLTVRSPEQTDTDEFYFGFGELAASFQGGRRILAGEMAHFRRESGRYTRIALMGVSALEDKTQEDTWSLTFSAPFTGYLVLDAPGDLRSGMIFLDPSSGAASITMTVLRGDSTPRQIETTANTEVRLY